MGKVVDLTGQRFGRLTVIKRADDYIELSGRHRVRWLCKCDCGNYCVTSADRLKSGKTRSCRCLSSELSRKRLKKYNTYDLSGEYGIGYTNKGEEFYFDLEDYDKIKDYYWYKNDQGYCLAYTKDKTIRMHKILIGGEFIDHINHNVSDNRKTNLRSVTKSQNSMNNKLRQDNTSGVTGVYWHKQTNKWCAYIDVASKRIYLGEFDNFEDAVKARKEAEEKYFGEYSYNNSMETA